MGVIRHLRYVRHLRAGISCGEEYVIKIGVRQRKEGYVTKCGGRYVTGGATPGGTLHGGYIRSGGKKKVPHLSVIIPHFEREIPH